MIFDEVFDRFAKRSPLTVMTRATMEHALDPQALDVLFDQTADRQYTRKLLFSMVVEVMVLVVCNKISVRRATKMLEDRGALGVSLQAVYSIAFQHLRS